jgi:hypothetical protein
VYKLRLEPKNLARLPAHQRPCHQSPSQDSDVEAAAACECAPSLHDHWMSPANCETGPAQKAAVRIPWGTAMPPLSDEKASHCERDLGEGLSKLSG